MQEENFVAEGTATIKAGEELTRNHITNGELTYNTLEHNALEVGTTEKATDLANIRAESKEDFDNKAQVEEVEDEQPTDHTLESKVRIVVAITTLLTNAPEPGNSQLKEGLLETMLVMARSDEYTQQVVDNEAIIAASDKKKDVTAIVSQGLDIVKAL